MNIEYHACQPCPTTSIYCPYKHYLFDVKMFKEKRKKKENENFIHKNFCCLEHLASKSLCVHMCMCGLLYSCIHIYVHLLAHSQSFDESPFACGAKQLRLGVSGNLLGLWICRIFVRRMSSQMHVCVCDKRIKIEKFYSLLYN